MSFGSFSTFQSNSVYASASLPLPSNKTSIEITGVDNTRSEYTDLLTNIKYYNYNFRSNGSITFSNVSGTIPLSVLAVGGGGKGGNIGGGGAGGMVEKYDIITSTSSININIGQSNSNTTIDLLNITALAGGRGYNSGQTLNGGSGGGGYLNIDTGYQVYGLAEQPTSSSGGYGNNGGGGGVNSGPYSGGYGGGGGAGTIGETGTNATSSSNGKSGNGGTGKQPTVKGLDNTIYYAGGGGGRGNGDNGIGGLGGGGNGGNHGSSGQPNSGGGGGGGNKGSGYSGGSGVVIIAIPQENVSN